MPDLHDVPPAPHARPLPLEHWLAEPPWSLDEHLALPGHVRGLLLGDWAAHVERRWGPRAVQELRGQLGEASRDLPDAPHREAWLPVGLHVALADLLAQPQHAGDLRRLEPVLWEDATRRLTRLHRILARAMGPTAALRRVGALHSRLYDRGHVVAEVGMHDAVLTWTGSPLFGDPTWRVLQLFAHRGALLLLTGHARSDVRGAAVAPDGFAVHVSWR